MNIREMLKMKNEFENKVGHTEQELDKMWNYLIGKHRLITQLNNCGQNWRDLNINAICTLEREYNNFKENV